MVKDLLVNAGDTGDTGLIPGSRRSPGGENDNPVQYFCLENSMDRGALWATFHGVIKCRDTTEHAQSKKKKKKTQKTKKHIVYGSLLQKPEWTKTAYI